MRDRSWHLRHAAWVAAGLPAGVTGPARPISPTLALSRLICRLSIIRWHLSEVTHARLRL
jgi:hypothetical protein